MLKKEFKRKDVNRMRNLIQGKTGDSIETQIGYKKKTKDYKEGDIWTEKKKTWTIKNGIKQTISKLDKIKKEVFVPLCCPKCNKVIRGQVSKENYKHHKKCLNCVVEFEHKLRIRGQYDNYIKDLETKNSLGIVDDMETYLLNAINSTNEGYVSEKGEVERWVGGFDKQKWTKDITNAAQERRNHLKKKLNEEKIKRAN